MSYQRREAHINDDDEYDDDHPDLVFLIILLCLNLFLEMLTTAFGGGTEGATPRASNIFTSES